MLRAKTGPVLDGPDCADPQAMRRDCSAILVICLALVCGGSCSDQSQAPPTPAAPQRPAATAVPSVSTPGDPVNIGSAQQFAKDMLAELAAVRAGQSLGEWKKNHPAGSVEVFTGRFVEVYGRRTSTDSNDRWCAHVRLETPFEGNRRLRRHAYFSLPDPPVAMALPTGAADEILDHCRLVLISADVQNLDLDASIERFAEVTNASLVPALGQGQANVEVPWWSGWDSGSDETILWRQNGLSVVTTRISSRMLVAAAADPFGISTWETLTHTREKWVERFRAIESRINEAISIAAVGGARKQTFARR
jgi:hypothetical protein